MRERGGKATVDVAGYRNEMEPSRACHVECCGRLVSDVTWVSVDLGVGQMNGSAYQ